MTHFTCTCGNTLFFENTRCLQCQKAVGYSPELDRMLPVEQGGEWAYCQNGFQYAVCNWLVPAADAGKLCRSCQFNRTIADLSVPGNIQAWGRLEAAKRRVLHTLARLSLYPETKAESPDGLAFDFLAPLSGQPVLTGHADGVITLNIYEADDAYRESQRTNLGEPYRTLIGHFRHELGHYYWDRFFRNRATYDPIMQEFRRIFGDERVDYAASLQRHYQAGGSGSDPAEFITAYAAAHPWEDWAETWAQFLHLTDALETVRAFGWKSDDVPIPFTPLPAEMVFEDTAERFPQFLKDVNDWAKMTPALNEIAASLGQGNLYPFVFSTRTARKMAFVNDMVRRHGKRQNASTSEAGRTEPAPAPVSQLDQKPAAEPATAKE
jgi:hypothetical protein